MWRTNLQTLLIRHPPFEEILLQSSNRVLLRAHLLNLLASPVRRPGVGHSITYFSRTPGHSAADSRMPSIPISDHLHHQRSLARRRPLLGKLGGFPDGEDIHSVDLKTRDLVAASEEGSVHGRSLGGCAHSVLVVLADEHAGEIP